MTMLEREETLPLLILLDPKTWVYAPRSKDFLFDFAINFLDYLRLPRQAN